MKLDAMKRQGQRTDLTCEPLAHKLRGMKSRDVLAEQVGESKDQIRRYIRLTEFITPILDMVDEGKIAMRPAVELSYLPKEQQQVLFDTMEIQKTNLSKKEKSNTDTQSTHSIPILSPDPSPLEGQAAAPPERKRKEPDDAYRVYEEIVKDNICYDILKQDMPYDHDRIVTIHSHSRNIPRW